LLVLSFASCQEFFTTSLASSLARDPADLVPTVTEKNAAELAELTSGDADASLILLDGLTAVIADASAAEKVDLAVLALGVATSASDLESTLLESSSDLLNLLTAGTLDDVAVYALVEDALSGLGNLSESAAALTAIFTASGAPSINAIAATASAEDMAMAAIMLLSSAASADSGGVSSYIGAFDPTSVTLTATEQLAVDLATAAATKYAADGGTGALADMLSTLNLTV
jgi:hypothetical protein